jgi:MFS family permease
MFVTDAMGLIICRVVLGAAEAGFWPGAIYYLSTWFSKSERGIRIGLFYITSPLSGVIAGLLSYGILQMDGLVGLAGWQWLFMLEGIPSVILGILTAFVLPTSPETATFLLPEEKKWVLDTLSIEQTKEVDPHSISKVEILQVFKDWRVWMFCVLSLGHNCMGAIVSFFLPSIINQFNDDPIMSNLLSAGPFGFGVVCIIINSLHSDHTRERPGHLLVPFTVQIIAWALVGISFYITRNWAFQYSMLTLAVGVHFTFVPIFWAWLTAELKGGTTVAVSTALVASFGTIGSIVTPPLTTWILEIYNQNYLWVMVVLASFGFFCLLVGIILAFLLKKYPQEGNYLIIDNEESELTKNR